MSLERAIGWRTASVLLLAGAVATPLAAQAGSRTAGRIVRVVGRDTLSVPGTLVVLHRVGEQVQGPIDSMTTDPNGRFHFRFQADTTANYLLSVRYAEIAYFSEPIAINPARPDTMVRLVVFDTSSTAPVGTRTRTLLIGGRDEGGARTVVDWFTIRNPGRLTRISSPARGVSWSARLPRGALNFELGDARLSQFSPDAVQFRNDSVLVDAPIAPGEKELLIQYQLPLGMLDMSLPVAGVDSMELLLEERGATIETPGWTVTDSQRFEGRTFRRYAYRGKGNPPATVAVSFPGSRIPPNVVLPVLIAAFVAGGLAVAAWVFVRQRRTTAGPAMTTSPDHPVVLADRIARLDQAHAQAGDDEARYHAEREALKARLTAALARRNPRS